MAPSDSHTLAARARRAYEWGRLRAQVWLLVPVLLLTGIALHFHRRPAETVTFAALLALATVGLRWYGREPGRGVIPGLVAGGVAFCFPLLACATGVCSRAYSLRLLILCTLAGAVAGGFLTFRALRGKGCALSCIASSGVVAALTASLSCSVAGFGGILGMVLGLLVAGAPAVALARQT